MTTTNLLVVFTQGFEENPLFLELSSEGDKGCSKPPSNSHTSILQSIFNSTL